MWKRFLGIMAAALCVLNLTVGSAFSADLVKVPTAWLDEHETFLMWYAKEKGWDKEAGLDIEMKLFNSGPDILNALPPGNGVSPPWAPCRHARQPALRHLHHRAGQQRGRALHLRRRPRRQPHRQGQGLEQGLPRSVRQPRDRARQDLPRHHADLVALRPQHVAQRPRPQGQRRGHQEHGPVAGRGRV